MNNKKVILLVEDNPDDQELALRAFRHGSVANPVVVAHDGPAALQYLFETTHEVHAGARMPAVVLLDVKLPGMNGHEVLRRIRADARTRCLPVVMLTSSREDADVAASYRLGANSYVPKPVDFTQFVEAVRQLSMYWLLLNVPSEDCMGSLPG
jgi:two-component system, response regulator